MGLRGSAFIGSVPQIPRFRDKNAHHGAKE
jgi:hypothetical protein